MYPLVRELAVDGIPVTVTCRVLKIARQPYYRWLAEPGHRRRAGRGAPGERAVRRPPRRPGVRLPVPGRRGPRRRPADGRPDRVADLLGQRLVVGVRQEARPQGKKRARPARRRTTTSSRRDFTADGAEPAVAGRHHRAPDRRGQALPLRDQGRVLATGSSATRSTRRMKARLAVAALDNAVAAAPQGRRRRLHRAHRPRVAISIQEVRTAP